MKVLIGTNYLLTTCSTEIFVINGIAEAGGQVEFVSNILGDLSETSGTVVFKSTTTQSAYCYKINRVIVDARFFEVIKTQYPFQPVIQCCT